MHDLTLSFVNYLPHSITHTIASYPNVASKLRSLEILEMLPLDNHNSQ